MLAEKFRRLRPGKRRCMGTVIGGSGIHKRVRRAGVGMKLVSFAEFCKFGGEFAHILRRRIFVFGAEVTLDRAIDLTRTVERRWTFAERHHHAAAVEHHAGFQILARGGHEINQPPAHAKTDDA